MQTHSNAEIDLTLLQQYLSNRKNVLGPENKNIFVQAVFENDTVTVSV